ncbi:hypothetical protein L1987_08913 [Smallanthus sonchifolius]|uniref:Uncharacterized protein n=1 Tax=Smallanthus sonchifolius TaxID=185202 RepID=A0ACB9JLX7_9ASTR|nr:hypothetical protein L1987_08913 [Smallanthus sonchifolius]
MKEWILEKKSDFGHITEDCIALRKEISYLLSKGHLKEFLGKGKNKTKDHDRILQRAKSPPSDDKVIGFISGGSDICGTSYSTAKRNANEAKTEQGDRPIRTSNLTEEKVISFDVDDRNDVQDPHHDGLVITLYIANHFIWRILIDGGSSVNIIQHEVLKRMGISDSKIISKSSVLAVDTRYEVGALNIPSACTLDAKNPDVKILVGSNIPEDIEKDILNFLKGRKATFAWKHEDMTEEVERLLKSRMIREVKLPKWLASVVVVQKKNGKWRFCVDYTDLNKACPKDPFPLPHIDSMVDATAGHEILTFMDASSGFQQIQMEPSDQEDTVFMTPTGIYCYIVMPFGLKNARATYQRLVNMMCKDKIGDTMEVYIDDMVVKSKRDEDHLRDLREAFDILDQYNMQLNPSKCHFGVGAGKFLGYMVTKRGIEASPEQIKAIINLKSPANTKDVQRLTDRVAALNRFISRSSERKPEMLGRMVKWSVKLSAYDLIYEPRTAIKSQALADFVVDFSSDIQQETDLEVQQLEDSKDEWTLFTDGASNVRGTGLGIILKSPQGDILPQSISLKGEKLAKYLTIVKQLSMEFETFNITQVPREDNTEADALENLASALRIPECTKIPIIHILIPAIEKVNEVSNTEEEADIRDLEPIPGSWISPSNKYLQDGEIPTDEKNHKDFCMRMSRFIIFKNVLYRKSIAGPYLRCLEDPEAREVLKDLHEGDCSNHTGGRALYSRILRTGYYWTTMRKDAVDYSQNCDACQRHRNILHQPVEPLYPIISPWPFMKWGMDIVGKLPKAPGGKVFMLAMTDYFSKWIEAEAFVQVREKEVISFIKRNILTRFGILENIVCDNGSQFIGKRTTDFYASWGIKMITFTQVHPQVNGQAESSNKIIVNNLKKRLGWVEELPFILWEDRTTTKNATGHTPFSLVFGTESMIPTEMVIPTARTNIQSSETKNEALA